MKGYCLLGVVVISLFIIPVSAEDLLADTQVFPSDYIWNVPVDNLPIHAHSAEFIKTEGGSSTNIRAAFNYALYIVNESSVTRRYVTAHYVSPGGLYDFPVGKIEVTNGNGDGTCNANYFDCSVVVVNTDTNIDYDYAYLDGTIYSDGSQKVGSAAKWPLDDYSLDYSKHGSTVASTSSHLVGQVRYEEVQLGAINHAIQIAIPYTRYGGTAAWPAQWSNSVFTQMYGDDVPRMGERFRLNASFNEFGYAPSAKIVIKALKKYGMIVVDSGDMNQFEMRGFRDTRWNSAELAQLRNIKITDLEAVDESGLMISVNSGKAKGFVATPTRTLTPTPTPTTTPTDIPDETPATTARTPTPTQTPTKGATVAPLEKETIVPFDNPIIFDSPLSNENIASNIAPSSNQWCGIQNLYFQDVSSGVGGFHSLSNYASGNNQTDENVTIQNTDGLVLVDSYISGKGSPGSNVELLSGLRQYNIYSYASSVSQPSYFTINVSAYDVITGKEQSFYNVTSPAISGTTPSLDRTFYVATTNLTFSGNSRLLIRIYAYTTRATVTTIHFLNQGNTPTYAQSGLFDCPDVAAPISPILAVAPGMGVGMLVGLVVIRRRRFSKT